MQNRITIKFVYGYTPYVAGDIATVAKHEADWFVKCGYAEIHKSPLEKEAESLSEVVDPESVSTEPVTEESAQDEATTEPETTPAPETEKQAETTPAADKSIHGPKKKKAR